MEHTDIALLGASNLAQEPAKQTQKKYTFSGPAAPSRWKKRIGLGHFWIDRINDAIARISLLPKEVVEHYTRDMSRWKTIGISVPLVCLMVLAGGNSGCTALDARSARIKAEEIAEVARLEAQARADAAAAEAKALADATQNAGKTFAAFVGGAKTAPAYFATVAQLQSNPDAMKGIKDAITAAVGSKPFDNLSQLASAGAWMSPMVFKPLPGGDVLFGVLAPTEN